MISIAMSFQMLEEAFMLYQLAATNNYENTRSSVQKYINAKNKDEIVFTKGATEAINLVANTLVKNI